MPSFEIKWMLLAEAVAQNADGILSVIGLSQNIVIARELPAKTKRALIVRVDSDSLTPPADQLLVEFSVVSPSNKTVVALNTQAPLGPARFPGHPWTVQIPAEITMTVKEFGTHVVRAAVTIGGTEREQSMRFHVIPADEALPILLGAPSMPLAEDDVASPTDGGP